MIGKMDMSNARGINIKGRLKHWSLDVKKFRRKVEEYLGVDVDLVALRNLSPANEPYKRVLSQFGNDVFFTDVDEFRRRFNRTVKGTCSTRFH